eukprot:13691203-Alexandrium_andersonii.AAC.1
MPPRRRKPERVLRWDFVPDPPRSGPDVQLSLGQAGSEPRWRDQQVPQGGPYGHALHGARRDPPGGPWPTMDPGLPNASGLSAGGELPSE